VGYAWGQDFPIIRLLWTSSMVLFTAGLSLLLLALFYWLIDVRGYKKWAFFFIVIGANPITIFVLQSIVEFNAIGRLFVIGVIQYAEFLKPLILPLAALTVKWLFLWFLYRRKIFLKV
jgi:predicted acyltransferase